MTMKLTSQELELYNEFGEAAMLNKKHEPWFRRRESGLVYAFISITTCKGHEWYAPFVGIECLAELRFKPGTGKLIEAYFVRLTNTGVNHGASIGADCFSII